VLHDPSLFPHGVSFSRSSPCDLGFLQHGDLRIVRRIVTGKRKLQDSLPSLEVPECHLHYILFGKQVTHISSDSNGGKLDSTSQWPSQWPLQYLSWKQYFLAGTMSYFLLCPSLETIFLISSFIYIFIIIHYSSYSFFYSIVCLVFQLQFSLVTPKTGHPFQPYHFSC
jgi:hypothetical protein